MKKFLLFLMVLFLVPSVLAVSDGYCKITNGKSNVGYWLLDSEDFCTLIGNLLNFNVEWFGFDAFSTQDVEDESDFCDGWEGECVFDVSDVISGSGGSSGGRSGRCNEVWDCSAWGDCINGEQSRVCIDLKDCGTNEYRPGEIKSCQVDNNLPNSVDFTGDVVDDTVNGEGQNGEGLALPKVVGVSIVIVLALVAFVLYLIKR